MKYLILNNITGASRFLKTLPAMLILLAFFTMVALLNSAFAQSAFDDPGTRSESSSRGGDLTVVDGDIDAGAVALGSASQVVILLRNDSGKPISAGTISLYPSSNVSAEVGENECVKSALPPDAVCAIALSIKGLQSGRFRIEMLLRHDGRKKLVTSTVSGAVERSEDNAADIISDLETIPSELKFGNLKESRPLTRSVILRNVTSKPIIISDVDIESNDQAGYSLKSDCGKLLSGAACIATVTWAPQKRGPSTGVMVVNHDGPTGVISVILDGLYEPGQAQQVGIFPEAVPGKGLLTSSQEEVNFGSGIESSSSITVSLVNVGDANLTLGALKLSGENNGLTILSNGCQSGTELAPVEACPLTLQWEPVREGSILDDVQILHDGARGILVLPVRGAADKAVNRDSKSIVFGGEAGELLRAIPPISASDVGAEETPKKSSVSSSSSRNVSGALEGYKVTSLAKNRAIISGPGGSRVVFNAQETVIGGVLWRVNVRDNAVEFSGGSQKILLLFDRSLTSTGSSESQSSSTSSNSEGN